MRGRAGPVTEISVFATEISVTGMEIFAYEHSSPVTGTKLFKQIVHGPRQVPGTTKGEKTRVISDERLYEGLFKFT